MRKSPDVSEEIKIKRLYKGIKHKKLWASRKKAPFIYLGGGSWFLKAHVLLWLPLVGLSHFERSPVNPCQMEDESGNGAFS